jgi:DNA (cytosine-5)-methyltransferase 1
VRRSYTSLTDFLRHAPKMLSVKATRGFLERTGRSGLRFPEGFIDALRAHERLMSAQPGKSNGHTSSATSAPPSA